MKFLRHHPTLQSALLLAFVVATSLLMANSTGRTGQTATTSTGCGNQPGLLCHGTRVNTRVQLTLLQNVSAQSAQIVGREIRVKPGSTTDFTLLVAHTNPGAGVDIAVKDSEQGDESAGTLLAAADGDVRYRPFATDGELSHSQPKRKAAGDTAVSFKFAWQAPSRTGTYYLRAISNAVNLNGVNDANDAWNWLQPVRIIVENTVSVNDAAAIIPSLTVHPNPCRDEARVSWTMLQSGSYEMRIYDTRGSLMTEMRGTVQAGQHSLRWDAANIGLANGSYMAVLRAGGAQRSLTFVVAR